MPASRVPCVRVCVFGSHLFLCHFNNLFIQIICCYVNYQQWPVPKSEGEFVLWLSNVPFAPRSPENTHSRDMQQHKKSFICLLNYFKTVVLRGLPTFSLPILGGGG